MCCLYYRYVATRKLTSFLGYLGYKGNLRCVAPRDGAHKVYNLSLSSGDATAHEHITRISPDEHVYPPLVIIAAALVMPHLHMQPAVEDHDFSAAVLEGTPCLLHHHPVPRFYHYLVRLAPVPPASLAVFVHRDNVGDKATAQRR